MPGHYSGPPKPKQAKAHPPGKPGPANPEPSSPYLPGKSPHKRAKIKIKPHNQDVNMA